MAEKEVIWSIQASAELKEILEYFIRRNGNPNYSLKLLTKIKKLLYIISRSPYIGRLTSNKTTRVIPLDVYLIFYEISEERIEVISFWDNRQDKRTL